MKLILQSTLRSLGITEKYAGFSLAVTAISLCFERPSRLRSVTKEVYWETKEGSPSPPLKPPAASPSRVRAGARKGEAAALPSRLRTAFTYSHSK